MANQRYVCSRPVSSISAAIKPSNICTAQVLLAASMYAVYHGSDGLKELPRMSTFDCNPGRGLKRLGYSIGSEHFFDTVRVEWVRIGSQNLRNSRSFSEA